MLEIRLDPTLATGSLECGVVPSDLIGVSEREARDGTVEDFALADVGLEHRGARILHL